LTGPPVICHYHFPFALMKSALPLVVSFLALVIPSLAIEPGNHPISRLKLGRADHDIDYELQDKKVDIGVGEFRNGGRESQTFRLAELDHYFARQEHKDFVTITFAKGAPNEDELKSAIAELESFFFSRLYKRVLFLQAFAGLDVIVHKDSLYADWLREAQKKPD
jgi:hypothetical protein